ncbi:MAG: hypothetical protein AABX17_03810 [Nanoarchaeota archaeon]
MNLHTIFQKIGVAYVRYAEWRMNKIIGVETEKPKNSSADYSWSDWWNAAITLHRMNPEERNKRFYNMPTPEPDAFLEQLAEEAYNAKIQKKRKSTIPETVLTERDPRW